ncbi:MAG TPA: ABC transporter substrate-binding protein [Burkholderiales bacterium]|nr:ABC transporter substrate-binding protein [Burkholderiales bacterium]
MNPDSHLSIHKLAACALVSLWLVASPAVADKRYGPGVSDTEIRIGQTMPYSGPASSYGTVGKAELAYFAKINAEGGINRRKITLVSLDDGYSPPRTVEQTRKLVEQDQVLLLFSSLGTPTNAAVQKYLNVKQVPQLFCATGGSEFGDPQHFPWTMGWRPNYRSEARVYAKYILKTRPSAKIAVLYQNDDLGKDYLNGLHEGLGDKASGMIVSEVSFEVTDPTVDSQIVTLQASGADTFLNFSTPKASAQAIRKVYDLGWRPMHLVTNVGSSVATVLKPAGLDKSVGLLTAAFLKDPTDKQWQNDPGYRDWLAWMKQYYPEGDTTDFYNVYGYGLAQTLVHVLKQSGDDLTRENVMRQAASLKNLSLPMLLPGARVNTTATDYYPIKQMWIQRFDGKQWVLFGDLIEP